VFNQASAADWFGMSSLGSSRNGGGNRDRCFCQALHPGPVLAETYTITFVIRKGAVPLEIFTTVLVTFSAGSQHSSGVIFYISWFYHRNLYLVPPLNYRRHVSDRKHRSVLPW
jgi:hypothetical protein